MLEIGQKIRIISDNENYKKYVKKTWKISNIAHNRQEHPGYDEGMGNEALIDCEGLPFSLYEYEFKLA
jgi:hypothetical protein